MNTYQLLAAALECPQFQTVDRQSAYRWRVWNDSFFFSSLTNKSSVTCWGSTFTAREGICALCFSGWYPSYLFVGVLFWSQVDWYYVWSNQQRIQRFRPQPRPKFRKSFQSNILRENWSQSLFWITVIDVDLHENHQLHKATLEISCILVRTWNCYSFVSSVEPKQPSEHTCVVVVNLLNRPPLFPRCDVFHEPSWTFWSPALKESLKTLASQGFVLCFFFGPVKWVIMCRRWFCR